MVRVARQTAPARPGSPLETQKPMHPRPAVCSLAAAAWSAHLGPSQNPHWKPRSARTSGTRSSCRTGRNMMAALRFHSLDWT